MAVTTIPTAGIADDAVTSPKILDNNRLVSPIIINGDMSIAQRGTSSTSQTSSGIKTVDRMRIATGGGMTFTIEQASESPSEADSVTAEANSGTAETENVFNGNTDNFANIIRGSTFIGLENGKWGSLTFEYGIDDQFASQRNHFYAGILSANVMKGLTVNSLIGTQRGGLKCVAGICRIYPSFAGARVELLFSRRL